MYYLIPILLLFHSSYSQNFPHFHLFFLQLRQLHHFRDFNNKPYNKSFIVILSPVCSPSLDPPVIAAFLDTSTTSVKFVFSSTIIAVIIFKMTT